MSHHHVAELVLLHYVPCVCACYATHGVVNRIKARRQKQKIVLDFGKPPVGGTIVNWRAGR